MPLIESIALSLGTKVGSSGSLALLKQIAGLQDEQVAVLKEMREDIRGMVERPWRKAKLLVEQAGFTTDPGERRTRLQEARAALFDAYSQEAAATPRRAMIAVDIALVHGMLDEPDHARRWATKAHEDQIAAVSAAVEVALRALNSRSEALKAAIDGDFWSLVDASRKQDPAGTERWITEKYERGELPAELPPADFLPGAGGSVQAQEGKAQEGMAQAVRALTGQWGAAASREHYRRWAWERIQRGGDDVRPFLAHVAIAETTSAGGRGLMRLHRMVRDAEEYRRARLALDSRADAPVYQLRVDLSHPRHARISWQPVPPADADEALRWRGNHEVADVAFSPDGTHLAAACGSTVHLLDGHDGRELGRLRHRRNTMGVIWSVAYSPDGRTIATGSGDHTARIWSRDGHELRCLRHLTVLGFVRDVAFSADGRWLATAAGDHAARLWDSLSGRQLLKVSHDKPVWSVAISPEGNLIASAGEDDTVRLWSAPGGHRILRLQQTNPLAVAFSPTGRLVAASGERTRVWDTRDGREVSSVAQPSWSVAFSPDGRWLAISGKGTVRVVDVFGAVEHASYPHGDLVTAVAFSPDGQRLATACHDGTVRVWRLRLPRS